MVTHMMLRDLVLIARLQKQSASLCPVEALIRPRWPVWMAARSLLTIGEASTATYVLNETRGDGKYLQGFLQVEQLTARPEMHLHTVAPYLGNRQAYEDTRTIWSRLINRAVSEAAEHRIERIYATVADGSEAQHVLRSLGFSVYTRQEIFRLEPDTHPQAIAQAGIRPEQSTDSAALARLYREVVPHLVQQAEALTGHGIEAICGPMSWDQGEGFILEDDARILGYGHLLSGNTGHWLSLLVHPDAYGQAERLLDYGLALLNYYPPLPVYCVVREYQGGVRVPLQDRRFTALSTYCRMVKHTTVRVTEPARTLVPTLDPRTEVPRPTASHTEQQ